jgi:hypothetical protein
MNNKWQASGIIVNILLSVSLVTVLCTVFSINPGLINGVVSGKYFWFYVSVTALSVVAIPVTVIKRRERLSFKLPDLLILLFCAAAVLITVKHTGRLTNKCMLLIFVTAFYFYLRIFLAGKSKLIYGLCGLAFVITGLVETVWGFMQLYNVAYSQHNLFQITGSFFNPGPYSGWLATVFPMALGFVLFNSKGINRKWREVMQNFLLRVTSWFRFFNCKGHKVSQSFPVAYKNILRLIAHFLCLAAVLSIILILPAAMSRASWLATLGGSAFIGIMYVVSVSGKRVFAFRDYFKKNRKKIIVLSIAVIILLTVLMLGLFFLKKNSALGRAFTWKIAVQTIVEHPMGVGLGNFAGSYGDVQATYFASGTGSERDEYVAGGVEYAFNEYLQICIETGIIPFLFFLAFVVYVLVLGIRNKNIIPAGSLVSLLIFASMSYPFNVLPFVIAFVFLSALCMTDNNNEKSEYKKTYPKFVIWAFLITVPVSIALIFQYSTFNLQFYNTHKRWDNTNINNETVEGYARRYPYLQDEIIFLFGYAQSLSALKQYNKSNEILRKAMQISCNPVLYIIMGENCQALKQYELAEQSFRKAANIVPYLLYPHYMLAKLYHETEEKDKMESEINIVMTKPPKVESMAIEEMREELIELKTKH